MNSAYTFPSSMKHDGKATIVGAVTSGAFHAISVVDVNEKFILQDPIYSEDTRLLTLIGKALA